MRFVIVTGMSGAGKSTALKMLEDVGYYCVDNLPVLLVPTLAELTRVPNEEINKIAVGIDIRNRDSFSEFGKVLDELTHTGFDYEILFLDSRDDVLIKRYKETRRNHPLAAPVCVLFLIDRFRRGRNPALRLYDDTFTEQPAKSEFEVPQGRYRAGQGNSDTLSTMHALAAGPSRQIGS